MNDKTNEQIAVDFATMRARDVAQVEQLPPATPGQWYVKRRNVYGDDDWQLEPVVFACGRVAVIDHGAFVVVDFSGARVTQFFERADAEQFAQAIGEHVERMFARASHGSIHAAFALTRLATVHRAAARRRGATGKPWSKREAKACAEAFALAPHYGVHAKEGVRLDDAREPITVEVLKRSLACTDEKLRRWRLKLLARVEREGLPRE